MDWDCEALRKSNPGDYENKGNRYLNDLKANLAEIHKKLIANNFAPIIPLVTDIACTSRFISAHSIAEQSEFLLEHLEQYKTFNEGQIRMKLEFNTDQEKKAVELFIHVLQAAEGVFNQWDMLRHSEPINNRFTLESILHNRIKLVDQLESHYQLRPQTCKVCVICQWQCQLI